jgi:hypothetical protein
MLPRTVDQSVLVLSHERLAIGNRPGGEGICRTLQVERDTWEIIYTSLGTCHLPAT